AMARAQLALNVDNLDEAIRFYSTLFNTQPAKVKEGYANFAIAEPPLKLVLLEHPGKGGTINHLGVEVDSSDQVHTEIARLTNAGMFTEERDRQHVLLRHAGQGLGHRSRRGKVEVYTVLADLDTFGAMPESLA
ncbi:ArsI/CadI family heavy metal resistance metalloenzyme, partial [Mycobacterium sp.]|uniref:ArsI/CadI family heavy metal resistance metalloenzyme n=1 Tax=Mycobacterium sp. TaxID=1785 RepID=UPI003C7514C0